MQALKLLAAPRVGQLLQTMVQANADLHIGGCADLLARASAVPARRGELQGAAQALLDAMPGDPARPSAQADAWRRERADAAVVHDTLRALGHADLADIADRAVAHLQARVSLDLAPPADWQREARMSCCCEHCQSLSLFLQNTSQEGSRQCSVQMHQGRKSSSCRPQRSPSI